MPISTVDMGARWRLSAQSEDVFFRPDVLTAFLVSTGGCGCCDFGAGECFTNRVAESGEVIGHAGGHLIPVMDDLSVFIAPASIDHVVFDAGEAGHPFTTYNVN